VDQYALSFKAQQTSGRDTFKFAFEVVGKMLRMKTKVCFSGLEEISLEIPEKK
jgi:hypothetical protein